MRLTPEEFQEWLILFCVKHRCGSDDTHFCLGTTDLVSALEFLNTFMLALPEEAQRGMFGDTDRIYITEHTDTLTKHPKRVEDVLARLRNERVLTSGNYGYVFDFVNNGKERFKELSRKLRDELERA